MTEAFLHYLWHHQMLGTGLTTTDGQPVVVHRPGELNRDAGPDFFNARVSIGCSSIPLTVPTQRKQTRSVCGLSTAKVYVALRDTVSRPSTQATKL